MPFLTKRALTYYSKKMDHVYDIKHICTPVNYGILNTLIIIYSSFTYCKWGLRWVTLKLIQRAPQLLALLRCITGRGLLTLRSIEGPLYEKDQRFLLAPRYYDPQRAYRLLSTAFSVVAINAEY